MATNKSFLPLSSIIAQSLSDKKLSPDQVKISIASNFNKLREKQTLLHFVTSQETLGPGHLVGYDLERKTVEIQLLGDNRIHEYTFDQINDFGQANYANPETMGETLIGAFWEAKITRRYLERIVANSYARLSPEEIDSFGEIANVNQVDVADLFPLEISEADVKQHICDIIGHPFVQKDWGGETCDLFCNLNFRRRSVPAAFLLKGKSYASRPLRIADLGKNGDQLVRLFSLPVEIFIIQSNGPIDGAIYSQIQAQVAEKLMTNQPIYYLVLDGIQTARLLRAYDKI